MKKYIFISGLLIIIIGVTTMLIGNNNNTKSIKQHIDNSLHFNFKPNKYSSYKLEYMTTFAKNQYNISSNIDMKAILNTKVLEENNKLYILFKLTNIKLAFDNPYLEKILSNIYSKIFLIEISKNGKFINYYLPKDSKKVGLFNLISLFEIIIKNSSLYTTQEKDAINGIYECTYRIDKDIYKTRQKYISDTQNITIDSSYIKAVADKKGNWLFSLKAIENIQVNIGNSPIKTKNELQLTKIAPVKFSIKAKNIENIINAIQNEQNIEWSKITTSALKHEIKQNKITFNSLINKFLNSHDISDLHKLEIYLKLNPNEIDKLYDIMANSNPNINNRLIAILEHLNLPQSQNLLADIANDSNFDDDTRLRAVIALGFQKNLSSDIIDTLWGIEKNSDNSDLSNTALLALGSISSNNANTQIDEKLKELSKQKNSISLIYSMKNSGVTKFKKELTKMLNSSNTQIKTNAIEVLSNVNDPQIHNKLVSMIDSKSNNVEAAAIKALSKHPDEKTLKYVQSHIKDMKPKVTEAMVDYLVKTMDKHPENKTYLKEVLPLVQDNKTKKVIIKAIRN